jgi:RNA polymerase sigma-70 factor (ECF subfamily)
MKRRSEYAVEMLSPHPDAPAEDATLARRVGQAAPDTDREAEAELCRRLAPRVRLFGLRHLGNEAAAADLMQQVMLLMIERLRAGVLREPERLASFVFGICRMVVLDLRRGQARRDRLLQTYAEALSPPEAPAPNFGHRRLALCLERLPERVRTVLLLTFYDDMSAEALARSLDLSPANVRVIRHRGLARLRACVTEETE